MKPPKRPQPGVISTPGASGPPRGVAEPPIKLLIVDDNPLEADLCLMELRRAGITTEAITVADETQLYDALSHFVPDVVLCDFSFPDFDGFQAQRIVRSARADTPLIFISGVITEDRAVLALQSGAVDYVLKSNLLRLPSAVRRAVADSREKLRLKGSVASGQLKLEASQELLRARELRSRQHAARLEALWRIADRPNLVGADLVVAMMVEAEQAIHPGHVFQAVLGKIEANLTVIVGMGAAPGVDDPRTGVFQTGTRIALDQTIIPLVGRTQAWDDLATADDVPTLPKLLGWRAVISTTLDVGSSRYSLTLASLHPATTPFDDEDLSYVDVLSSAIAKNLEVESLQSSLRAEEERARQHAERLESLWHIVNSPNLSDGELWQAMLAQMAVGLRPGQAYWGLLWRIDGDNVIAEGVAIGPETDVAGVLQTVGASTPVDETIIGALLAKRATTASWDDVRDDPLLSDIARQYETRSLVITTFSAGGQTWGLSFASRAPTATPFGAQDHAYIEILASFFQNRVQQRWQFERIEYEQSHDVLTGLLNRSQFRSRTRLLSSGLRAFAIIIVDVTAFREVNQSYGSMIGDAILIEIASALAGRAAPGEIVGRSGGNIFAIFVPDPVSADFVDERARDFRSVFEHGFSTGDRDGREFITRTASVGVALAPDDGERVDTIFARAEAALLRAKERGHSQGSIVRYEAGMEDDAQRRAQLRNDLIEAVASDQFTLYYQPHVEMQTGHVTGCEALIRWNHPTRGLLMPGSFIPFAEETGIIASIDEWVMQQAFTVANELGAMRPDFRLYFNLSGRQAGDAKVIRAFSVAARRGIELEHIGVEITESDAMRDVEATRRVCRALRRLNVKIAIDDFGTGYSSLSSLKRLPVDVVKIDRSFVSGVLDDPHDGAITEAIIGIAERFGFASLAEGAETPEELAWLRERGCGYVQGYAICHPIPLDAFKKWLDESNDRARP
jgi:diguanylate cyclase (GGDEF)-like protein